MAFHGVSPFDPATGEMPVKAASRTYTEVFSQWLINAAERDERLWAITPAMSEGSGLVGFAERFPQRYVDVGIAEQHAVTLAAGMACEDLKPVVAIYSTFLQRGYDQLIHDVALQNLDVTFAVDRAGQVGADGATHAGSFDLSYARAIPNMVVMAPSDEAECQRMLETAYQHPGPALVRYPRGRGPGADLLEVIEPVPMGRGEVLHEGSTLALLAFGTMLGPALELGNQLGATVVNMRFVKPIDVELLTRLAQTHVLFVTLEENVVAGGAGSAVAEALAGLDLDTPVRHLGLPDAFIEHGSQAEQLEHCGLSATDIRRKVACWMGELVSTEEAPVEKAAP